MSTRREVSTRREQILAVARDLFATKGIKDASMRDIAEGSGLLAGSLYSHFRSKSEIVELVISPFYERVLAAQGAASRSGGTGADVLEAMLDRVFPLLLAHRDEAVILHYGWPQMVHDDELAHLVARSNEVLDRWREAVAAGLADGSLRTDVDAEVLVRMINSAMFSLIDRNRYHVTATSVAEVSEEDLRRELVAVFIAGRR
jgi:AcrR family transcriptional regulator